MTGTTHKIKHAYVLELAERSYSECTHCISEIELTVTVSNGVQFVVYRGTEVESSVLWRKGGWRDILRDLRFGVSYWHGLRGHAGILKGASLVCREILSIELDPALPVCLGGHSLGGGLALCSAPMLDRLGFDIVTVITAGAPKVLSAGHDQYRNWDVVEYMYGDDAVCQIPYFSMLRKHVKKVHIGKRKGGYFNRSFKDHTIRNYVDYAHKNNL